MERDATGDSPMYERTRFGTTPHSQKVVQDSDAYMPATDCKIKAPTSVGRIWLAGLRFRDAARIASLALLIEMLAKSNAAAPSLRLVRLRRPYDPVVGRIVVPSSACLGVSADAVFEGIDVRTIGFRQSCEIRHAVLRTDRSLEPAGTRSNL